MVWREVAFQTLARVADDDQNSALNNPLIQEAIVYGHVAMQVLAIRRLTDKSSTVLSLTKLLSDICSNRALLTRENYVCFDGLPYDYDKVEEEHYRTHRQGAVWLDTTGPNAFDAARRAHEQFDRLCGTNPIYRKRDDRLPVRKLVNTIEQWISDCGATGIREWSHNYLAHAGSVHSRKAIADYSVTGAKIGDAISGLAKATEAVSAYLLYSSGRLNALMPTPQFDQFERLKNPALVTPSALDLSMIWSQIADSYDESLDDVEAKLTAGASS